MAIQRRRLWITTLVFLHSFSEDTGAMKIALISLAGRLRIPCSASAMAVITAVVFALAAPRAIGSENPIVIRFSHVVANNTPKGKGALRFKELAEQMTRGRVRIDVYPNSTLYKDSEELEALQLGAVQILAPSLAKFGPLGIKEFELFDLPYIFPSKTVLYRVTQGEIGRTLFKKLEPKGIIGLAYWDNGFKVMSANRPLRIPEDFKGLKMRIQASRVLDAQMRALGANPQIFNFSDVYDALRQGLADGTENPPSNLYTQKMHEVQSHVTISNHGYLGYAVIVNRKFWESLPEDVRTALDGAMKEATRYANAIAQQENDFAMDAVRKTGKVSVYTLSPQEKAGWRKALAPVHAQMEERIGKELIEAVKKEASQTGNAAK